MKTDFIWTSKEEIPAIKNGNPQRKWEPDQIREEIQSLKEGLAVRQHSISRLHLNEAETPQNGNIDQAALSFHINCKPPTARRQPNGEPLSLQALLIDTSALTAKRPSSVRRIIQWQTPLLNEN
ncbi:hypothetical protein CEXT_299531 [Caerostris extrusa]|uniref:Transposase n=1 Tax=Caerostris extrusa TaxID=172846 RepID=A0AAV4S639_CAEEX|nr:hypothetical protein CEXT_299531 [Caerostris extrusa]